MKRRNEKKHVIDFLFPLAVFFVLAASSVAIVVLASGFYSRQVKASSDSYSGRTALAYVTEKMHQNDENGAIADGAFDGDGRSWRQRTSRLRKLQMGFFICIVKMKTGKRQIHLSV